MRWPDNISDYFSYHYAWGEAFWLLLIIPMLVVMHLLRRRHIQPVKLPVISEISAGSGTPMAVKSTLFGLEMIALMLLIVALARPQNPVDTSFSSQQYAEGIDILLAIDVSGSMLAEDFEPNRLEAAKEVAVDFVNRRKYDNIGLVVYEGEAFLQCPLTNDHAFVNNYIRKLEAGMVAPGTAIGTGLGVAAGHLYHSDNKSKVIILLTDGVSNTGQPPMDAALAAQKFGIRVYTIGVGTNGMAPVPIRDRFGMITRQLTPVEIDEEILTEIAEMTDGRYFRATNNQELQEIYNEIDKLEKSRIETINYQSEPPEEFAFLVLIAGILLILSMLVKKLWLTGITAFE